MMTLKFCFIKIFTDETNLILGRNFKGAKTITEERNKILEEGRKSQEELNDLEEKKTRRKALIDSLNKEFSEIKGKVLEVEQELGENFVNFLMKELYPADIN